jgi:hypothetical protein
VTQRSCSQCGTAAPDDDELPPGWSFATGARGIEWTCAACTREHVRSIEAKLPEEWW